MPIREVTHRLEPQIEPQLSPQPEWSGAGTLRRDGRQHISQEPREDHARVIEAALDLIRDDGAMSRRDAKWGWLLETRATRARPPGHACDDAERRTIYGAALQQFDELLRASEEVGYAARPLPLFYALSQAGRAIVAAYGDDPHVGGHGLHEDRKVVTDDLLGRAIRSSRSETKSAFHAVAAATRSLAFTGTATLGALWAATPGAYDVLLRQPWDATWCPPLLATGQILNADATKVALTAYAVGSQSPRTIDACEPLGKRYPDIPTGATLDTEAGYGARFMSVERSHVGSYTWRTEIGTGEHVLSSTLDHSSALDSGDEAWLIPAVNDHGERMSQLMLWWSLLFGLSIFARYHPALWARSLDIDRSDIAVSLQALLDVAPDAIAGLVWEAVTRPRSTNPRIFSGPDTKWRRMSAEEMREHDEAAARRTPWGD